MTDERVDELLADLDRALTVEPSPSLNTKIRMDLAHGPRRWLMLRRSAAAGGGVATALATLLLLVHSRDVREMPRAELVAPERQYVSATRPRADGPSADATSRVLPASAHGRVRLVEAQLPLRHEPGVLVPRDQLAAIHRLLLDARSEGASMIAPAEEMFGEIAPLASPGVLEIAALEIVPLGTLPAGEGDVQ